MTEEYTAYLDSDAWKAKRMQRLAIAKFRCAACASGKTVQVHHLTYARIFNEDMADLLPLCDLHHDAAEELIKKGKLTRSGDVLFLAVETVRLLVSHAVQYKPEPVKVAKVPTEPLYYRDRDLMALPLQNKYQVIISQEPWFVEALMLKRDDFKQFIKKKFGKGKHQRSRWINNACTIWDKSRRLGYIRDRALSI